MPPPARTTPTFFKTPAAFRAWLTRHHAKASELLVGFYTTTSGLPSLTWDESVTEALAYGWIDGVRRRIDTTSYTIRFTPRKPGSRWSAKNIATAKRLIAEGRMTPAGLEAFNARPKPPGKGEYSYENRPDRLPAPYERQFKTHPKAWAFFTAQPPSYRRTAIWWVVSAKQEATHLKRLATLIEDSANEERIALLRRR